MMLLGVDTGGTFTDFVLVAGDRLRLHKVLSTPDAPERAILQGIADMGLTGDVARGRLRIVHGSTVATNAALERKGVRTAYVANSGLADVLTLGRQNRRELYNLTPEVEPPPVPRDLCLEVSARLDARGRELEPLDDGEVSALAAQLEQLQVEAVAINLLYSWLDPDHETRLQAALQRALGPGVFVTRSSFVLPQYREYERGVATWLNAWLGPRVEGYLQRLQEALAPSRVAIMQSSGGTMEAGVASQRAVNLLMSGPAGGLAGASAVAGQAGCERLLTFDMGGTSTDVALIDGEPALTSEGQLGPWPVAVPMLDMHTVGAGGGSIAWLDAGGALQVGPASAGADPGPACYGKGGRDATVTDAHVVLGQLPASAALGGRLQLDVEASQQAVDRLANSMNVDRETAARGILDLANENMAQALRVMSIERGRDPRELTLCCFGGAGGLHLCDLAIALGMEQALVPCHSGVLSALGMLVARPERQLTQTLRQPLSELQPGTLTETRRQLEQAGRDELADEGHDTEQLEVEAFLELRYRGQAFALTLPYDEDLDALRSAFDAAHAHRYGHALDTEVELVTVRLRLRAGGSDLQLPERATNDTDSILEHVSVSGMGDHVPVHQRDALAAGQQLDGPALVTEATATSLIKPGWRAQVDALGNLHLRRCSA